MAIKLTLEDGGVMAVKKVVALILVVGLMIGGAAVSYAVEQSHMVAALEHLKAAKAELEMAAHNKGGHRVEAIKMINRAIDQVKKGIEAGEKY